MTYYITKDENLILNDLRQRKFLIEKEQKAEFEYYDTQINTSNIPQKDYLNICGVIILKSSGQISVISYYTFDPKDFQKKLSDIPNRGFIQTVENPTDHWIFWKEDTLVAIEKKVINLMNKKALRYEFSVTVVDPSNSMKLNNDEINSGFRSSVCLYHWNHKLKPNPISPLLPPKFLALLNFQSYYLVDYKIYLPSS